jgi:hypothetical protein
MNKLSVPAGKILPNGYQMGEVASGGMSSHFDPMLKFGIMLRFSLCPTKQLCSLPV